MKRRGDLLLGCLGIFIGGFLYGYVVGKETPHKHPLLPGISYTKSEEGCFLSIKVLSNGSTSEYCKKKISCEYFPESFYE